MISRVESNPWYGAMIAPGFAPILSHSSPLSWKNFALASLGILLGTHCVRTKQISAHSSASLHVRLPRAPLGGCQQPLSVRYRISNWGSA
jgi:hypothetical protein